MINPQPKTKPYRNKKYRTWISTLPCHKCGSTSYVQAAHQRILGGAGTGIKPPDNEILPLCFWCHAEEHKGAVTFFGQKTKEKTKEYVRELCRYYFMRYENENSNRTAN